MSVGALKVTSSSDKVHHQVVGIIALRTQEITVFNIFIREE